MRSFWALPLRRQLLVAILLLLVPVLVAAIWSGLADVRERRAGAWRAGARRRADHGGVHQPRPGEPGPDGRSGWPSDPAIAGARASRSRELFGASSSGGRRSCAWPWSTAAGTRSVAAPSTPPASRSTPSGWAARRLAPAARVIEPMRPVAVRAAPLHRPRLSGGATTAAMIGGARRLPQPADACTTRSSRCRCPRGSVVDDRSIATAGSWPAASRPDSYVGRRPRDGARRVGRPASRTQAVGLDGVDAHVRRSAGRRRPVARQRRHPDVAGGRRGRMRCGRAASPMLVPRPGRLARGGASSCRAGSASRSDISTAAAQRIAAGDFSPMRAQADALARVRASCRSAFDLMLRRFNETRHALDAQMAEERRIRQELESLQGQVIRQERLAAVGQLVSGVAHEINNPLQAILGFAELLQMQNDVPDERQGRPAADSEGERARLRHHPQPGAVRAAAARRGRRRCGWATSITSVAELRQRRLESEDIELRIDDRSAQHVLAVLTELQQVVLNFVVNAEQSIVDSGRLPGRITIRTYDADDHVVLEVEDTGPGVPPEHEAKLFQPFFTTKPVGQGTGLGLSVSYGIIDSLGGRSAIAARRRAARSSTSSCRPPISPHDRAHLLHRLPLPHLRRHRRPQLLARGASRGRPRSHGLLSDIRRPAVRHRPARRRARRRDR